MALFLLPVWRMTGKPTKSKKIVQLLKDSFRGFSEFKVPKLSASLAYYTVFSLGPLLIVIIFLCSLFLEREAIEGSIYSQLQGFVGDDAAKQIESIIKNASVSGKGGVAAIVGILTLLLGATTVFGELQDSINSIWGVKAKPKSGWKHLIKNRLLSFGLVASLGFLLLVSLSFSALMEALDNRLKAMLPDVTLVLLYILNLVLTLALTTLLFAVIYKVLPDALIRWKDCWAGALVTALLFMIGKFGISLYLSRSNVGETYGAAGSLVILLLWIYYSAFILYFGAVFTRHYASLYGQGIEAGKNAVLTKRVEVPGGAA